MADFIFHNGKVLTVDAIDSVQQALAISGNAIDVVGTDLDVIALAGANTTLVNLQGHTLIPCIIDIHAHMDREGLKRLNPSLEGTRWRCIRRSGESRSPDAAPWLMGS